MPALAIPMTRPPPTLTLPHKGGGFSGFCRSEEVVVEQGGRSVSGPSIVARPSEYDRPATQTLRVRENVSMRRRAPPRVRTPRRPQHGRRRNPSRDRENGLRQDPRRHPGRALHAQERRADGQGDDLRRHRHRDRRPDRSGKLADVVLGFDTSKATSAATRTSAPPSAGSPTGSPTGKFTLDGKDYTLAANNGPNSLHGGTKGFDKVVWKAEELHRPRPGGRASPTEPGRRGGLSRATSTSP